MHLREWRLAVGVQARWLRSGSIESPRSTVSIDEVGLGARVEVSPRWRVAPFGGLALVGAYLRAHAASMGRAGEDGVAVPIVEPSVGVRLTTSALDVSLRLSFQHSTIHQRFLVDGMVVADLERSRAALSLSVSLPL
jgi:hypothetical protein